MTPLLPTSSERPDWLTELFMTSSETKTYSSFQNKQLLDGISHIAKLRINSLYVSIIPRMVNRIFTKTNQKKFEFKPFSLFISCKHHLTKVPLAEENFLSPADSLNSKEVSYVELIEDSQLETQKIGNALLLKFQDELNKNQKSIIKTNRKLRAIQNVWDITLDREKKKTSFAEIQITLDDKIIQYMLKDNPDIMKENHYIRVYSKIKGISFVCLNKTDFNDIENILLSDIEKALELVDLFYHQLVIHEKPHKVGWKST
ncbi:MAG: hypothetical protein ACXU9U_01845, partial [Parachlamydiaceae bacterium]